MMGLGSYSVGEVLIESVAIGVRPMLKVQCKLGFGCLASYWGYLEVAHWRHIRSIVRHK